MYAIYRCLESGELQRFGNAALQFDTREDAEARADHLREVFPDRAYEVYFIDRDGRIVRDPYPRSGAVTPAGRNQANRKIFN